MSRRTVTRIHPLPALVIAASLLFSACSGSVDDEQQLDSSSTEDSPPTSVAETADAPPLPRTDAAEESNDAAPGDGAPAPLADASAMSVNDVFDDAGASPDLVDCYSNAYEEHAGITELTSFTQLRDVEMTPDLEEALSRCVDIANGD